MVIGKSTNESSAQEVFKEKINGFNINEGWINWFTDKIGYTDKKQAIKDHIIDSFNNMKTDLSGDDIKNKWSVIEGALTTLSKSNDKDFDEKFVIALKEIFNGKSIKSQSAMNVEMLNQLGQKLEQSKDEIKQLKDLSEEFLPTLEKLLEENAKLSKEVKNLRNIVTLKIIPIKVGKMLNAAIDGIREACKVVGNAIKDGSKAAAQTASKACEKATNLTKEACSTLNHHAKNALDRMQFWRETHLEKYIENIENRKNIYLPADSNIEEFAKKVYNKPETIATFRRDIGEGKVFNVDGKEITITGEDLSRFEEKAKSKRPSDAKEFGELLSKLSNLIPESKFLSPDAEKKNSQLGL